MSRELRRLRHAVDLVDDFLVAGLAARHRLVGRIIRAKREAALPAADPAREAVVLRRAQRLADRLELPRATALAMLDVAIADARQLQGLATDMDQGGRMPPGRMIAAAMHIRPDPTPRWLRLVPPPARLAPLTRRVPQRLQCRLLEHAVATALAAPIAGGTLDFMQGRRIGIEVSDLGLRWTLELRDGRLRVVDGPAEASVRGSATDLMRLAARLEDADTLFFQRRLVLTGDTELGLTARNVLDRLPWESVPLALRIVLNRAARLASEAREAYRRTAAREP
jgi:predicted lipid carrier protein YhbT/chorismate mutase